MKKWKPYCSFHCGVNIIQSLSWQHNLVCTVSDAQVWSSFRWNLQLSSFGLRSTNHLLLPHCAHFFFLSPSKLRSCQPTKELQTIKCRRMRIITSLLYSVEPPVPRSCLPSTHSQPLSWGECEELICSAHQEKNHSPDTQKKNVDDPDEQALQCYHKLQKLTCDLTTSDPDTK